MFMRSLSAFGCIETDFYFKAAIKKSPLMEVVLLASMRIEVGFDQGPTIKGINFKIICRYCQKNVFKDPDDDDDGHLYHPLVLLWVQCCHCQWHVIITGWNQLCCLKQKIAMQGNSSEIGCFILYQRMNKNLILITIDFALLTNPSWILGLEMINILYVQWTEMRQLKNCLSTLSK